ncbi:MoxR family ATPase [Phormidium yuhuli AB48]|uniref:MoxR family ATPase n=1 Tax=Phormidium yuhuli AB48 TaxID=2940671 RepID=A0ABY5AMC5_9CYAN|nr:MoxR family ATPase [Phormidium yuhuli]USR89965.1 MoxR family ATPase [Phormidium yuhuli AB48]
MDHLAPLQRLRENLSKTLVGKDSAVRLVLVALLAGGHALLEDVPGVGKTLLAKSLAKSIGGKFQRIQCTPDLLPTDITGTNIWNPQSASFEFLPGPVFANVLLADEINRATPRTQSALLEVMEEKQVTVDGNSRFVPQPFFTIATQNPIEYQGTFPLPEAQMDRFMLSLSLGYPTPEEELQMLQGLSSRISVEELDPCLSLEELHQLSQQVSQITVEPALQQYMVDLVRSTRADNDVTLGVSPRGAVALQRACQAYSFLEGRAYSSPDDVKFIAPYVLTHRMIPAGGRKGEAVIARLLETVPIP